MNGRQTVIHERKYKGKRVQDIWDFKDPMYPIYPTEKNLELLELIKKTSSNADSLVMDCFAGSGTTLKATNRLGRNWIGIDQSEIAIETIKNKLQLHKTEGLFSNSNSCEIIDLSKKNNVG